MPYTIRLEGMITFIGTALIPVYVFRNGGIQPAHAVFAVFICYSIFRYGLSTDLMAQTFGLFVSYVMAVEVFSVIIGQNPRYLMSAIFFVYNFFLFNAIYLYVRKNGAASISTGVIIAGLVALISVIINGVDLKELVDGRPIGSFNNPNQLGYFSVCLLSMTYLFYQHRYLRYRTSVILFGVSLFLSIVSLSKAAILANFGVVFLAVTPRLRPSTIVIWVAILVGALMYFIHLLSSGTFDDYLFYRRLLQFSIEGDSSLEARGYFTFLQGNPLQILFGMGSGNIIEIFGREVHSTFASVLNAYGALGLLGFLVMITIWTANLWRSYGFVGVSCIAGPAMLYGITHNGTRFTIFWLLVASSLAMSQRVQENRAKLSRANAESYDTRLQPN